ncbi:MAG: hypothetical protein J5365_06515 [Erysipelotrichaceae bacterium]|nr:hypothetical protein [Erysipelotrichaceae bacterium]
MKKFIILEIAVLIIFSVFVYTSYNRNRSFQSELFLKEKLVEQSRNELKELDSEYNQLAEKLEEVKNKDEAKQLDLWRRRLETLKEALD